VGDAVAQPCAMWRSGARNRCGCWQWVSRFLRLARRYERKAAHFLGFAQLACAVICYRRAIKLDLLTHNNPK